MNTYIQLVNEPDNPVSDENYFGTVIWMLFKTMEGINSRKLLMDAHGNRT